MTSRANRPDTPADVELRECLLATPPVSFAMIAGAGSGKTTSLVKALAVVISERGNELRKKRQKVACITYTENAVAEIWKDVGENPLVHVSTIHSFLWQLVCPFQNDIKEWVGKRIDERLAELRDRAANFGARVRQATRDANQRDIERYKEQRRAYTSNLSFRYGTGSDYKSGILGHNDIVTMAPEFISESALLRTVFAQLYPFLFVDESQDTMKEVVEAFKAIYQQEGERFCLGFFGDPMQRIYQTGSGAIERNDGWREIRKPENFRCPMSVLAVANAIRLPADGLQQTGGRMIEGGGELKVVSGTARIFVLPADDLRNERLAQVRDWIAEKNGDEQWKSDSSSADVKVLVIVHRMAARRLGFADLYAALNDRAPSSFSDNFLDASLWPVKPFFSLVLPLVAAARAGHDFDVMHVLREESPLMSKDALSGVDVAAALATISDRLDGLVALMDDGSKATVLDVLSFLRKTELGKLDDRLLGYIDAAGRGAAAEPPQELDPGEDGVELGREVTAMTAYLACPARQFWGYQMYVNEESPFSTQQGIKGAEFYRVLTVLDDDEGTHFLFSYNKFFGIIPLSANDLERIEKGEETQVERTQRLFYVCCTRAVQDLAVVLFAVDVEHALQRVRAKAFFAPENVHSTQELVGTQA